MSSRPPSPSRTVPEPAGALPASGREAQAARQDFDVFASRFAHEMQGVLQRVEGYAAALERQAADALDAPARHYLERIRHHAVHGNAMVQALAALHRVGSLVLEPGPLDLAALARRSWARLPRAAGTAFSVEGDSAGLQADAALLAMALEHLLANAARHAAAAASPAVHVRLRVQDGWCLLTVSDNGHGFDPSQAHRLFVPFSRLGEAAGDSGLGMGLATVRRVADRHGGRVWAESAPGLGATFGIELPLVPPGADAAALPARAAPAAGGLRVLLVDDDPMVLAAVGAQLERLGHRVQAASSGPDGLQAFEQALAATPFDIVLTDWGMPHVGGRHVAAAVKALSPQTPVFVLSGLPPHELQDEGGADRLLTKPLTMAALRDALAAVRPQGAAPPAW